MLVFEILWGLGAALMIIFSYGVVKNTKTAKALERQRLQIVEYHKMAENLLQRAKRLAAVAEIEQPFAVCDSCNQIRTRYVRDENGVTCIECAEKHTERE